jgi:hypothetical protein
MDDKAPSDRNEFLDALKKGALLGVLILVIVIPPMRMAQRPKPPAMPPVAQAPQVQPAPVPAPMPPQAQPAPQPEPVPPTRLADFGDANPSPDVRHVANWAVYTRDPKGRSFVIIDKKFARVYVFSPDGKLKEDAPALLGEAVGDDSAPGIGNKPLSQIKPWEKTTPAGRFVAEHGLNTHGEDIVWIDYEAAVSMHRIRKVKASERRFERMATPTYQDNRISNGCVNLPVKFYENVLRPAVKTTGAIIYVLPETRTPQQVFGSWDVTQPSTQASAGTPGTAAAAAPVATPTPSPAAAGPAATNAPAALPAAAVPPKKHAPQA